jgi:hypothetical protein
MTDRTFTLATTKRRHRHIRTKEDLEPIRITDRDMRILHAVGDYRLLTTSQIRKLFFRSVHKARKRLFKLWQHGLVDRRFQAISLGDKPKDTLYVPSRHGARLLAQKGGSWGKAQSKAKSSAGTSSLFIDHTIARNDFRIGLETSVTHTKDTRLVSWRHDLDIRQTVDVISGTASPKLQRVTLIADAKFTLAREGHGQTFFLEVDRGTVSLSRWRTRLAAYSKLLSLQQLPGRTKPFLLLVTTPSETRAENIASMNGPLQFIRHEIVFFATQLSVDNQSSNLVEASIWRNFGSKNAERFERVSLRQLAETGTVLFPNIPQLYRQ